MKTVREILDRKGRDVFSIGPGATVREALTRMAERGVGALVVVDEERVVGVISERDYARKVIILGKSSLETLVGDIMAPDPICVAEEDSISDCMAKMTEKRARHLPVLDGGRLVGLVSIGDVVKTIISEHESKIGELESYVYGQ